jgi:hypothetical protein
MASASKRVRSLRPRLIKRRNPPSFQFPFSNFSVPFDAPLVSYYIPPCTYAEQTLFHKGLAQIQKAQSTQPPNQNECEREIQAGAGGFKAGRCRARARSRKVISKSRGQGGKKTRHQSEQNQPKKIRPHESAEERIKNRCSIVILLTIFRVKSRLTIQQWNNGTIVFNRARPALRRPKPCRFWTRRMTS